LNSTERQNKIITAYLIVSFQKETLINKSLSLVWLRIYFVVEIVKIFIFLHLYISFSIKQAMFFYRMYRKHKTILLSHENKKELF